nr:hypothetical protein [Tanacetum cinerariifolium]
PLILGRPFLRTARALIDVHDIDSFNEIHPHFDDDRLSGSTTYSANSLLEEFADEFALISYPPDYDDYRACDMESDIREIEFLLFQCEDSDFKDSIDQAGEKIKEAELLIDPLDLPCDILFEYDSFNSHDFSRDDVLFSPNNEDKVKENPRKGQNQIKTGQKREAWRSREKSEAITVD